VALKPAIEMMQAWWRRLSAADQNAQSQKRRHRRLALLGAAAILAYWIFGGDQGLIALAGSWHESWSLKREIAELQRSNADLEGQQLALAKDRGYYEKIAREKLLLKNPGDLVYRFDRN
jgi:cell division protein FtsB